MLNALHVHFSADRESSGVQQSSEKQAISVTITYLASTIPPLWVSKTSWRIGCSSTLCQGVGASSISLLILSPTVPHSQEPTNLLFKTLDVFAPHDFTPTSALKQVTEIDAMMVPPQWKRFLSLVLSSTDLVLKLLTVGISCESLAIALQRI
jgi:hypothetical protein